MKSYNKLELGKFHKAVEFIVKEDKSGLGQLFKGNDTPQCDSKYSNFNLLQLGFLINNKDISSTLLAHCSIELAIKEHKANGLKPIDFAYLPGSNHTINKELSVKAPNS